MIGNRNLMWISSTCYCHLKQSEEESGSQNMCQYDYHEYFVLRRLLEYLKGVFGYSRKSTYSYWRQERILTIYNQCHRHTFVGSSAIMHSYFGHMYHHMTLKSLLLKFHKKTQCCSFFCHTIYNIRKYQAKTYWVLSSWFARVALLV